jgi:hypothetical protein
MDRNRHSLLRLLCVALLTMGSVAVAAQDAPRDGIDRNLLERQQQELEFHVKLYDTPRESAPPATVMLPPPNSFTVRESYERPPPTPPAAKITLPAPADPLPREQLNDSQLRRQLELQAQTRNMDELSRQQQSQTQQLQFGRENQAQQLQDRILRDSSGLMRQLR